MDILTKLHLQEIFTQKFLMAGLRILLVSILGMLLFRLLASILERSIGKKMTIHAKMLLKKGVLYSGFAIIGIYILSELGIPVTTLLGAAGILGLALGIASQTSLGNIISGLFLISEKTFEIGHVIKVDDNVGIVYSVDLLSIKLKTFDNLLIRIPNEKIISSNLINITRFPIRRMDFNLGVAYKEDLAQVREILLSIALDNPLCLDEPEPLILFKDFGESSVNILFAVWFSKQNYIQVKNSVFMEIKKRFDEQGIEIPFPHRTIYSGSRTAPFTVRVLDQEEKSLEPEDG